MDIRLFGPVTVSIDGNPVNVGRPLHKLLVAILASAGGRHVPTDSLIDQMWPLDAPEPRRSRDPRQRLYEVISDVRTALPKAGRNGKTMLSQGDQGYSLSVGRSEVDLLRFHDLWHRADDALERSADKQAVDLYRRAFREWGGDSTFPHRPEPYAGLTGVWVAHQRAQLGQTYRTALVHCAEAELRIGRHGRPVPELLALSADDPGNEQVAALLMRAYYGAGQIHRALEIYAQFRERLVADVGNEPGAPLQELHRRVLNRDPALSLASPPDRANRASEPADSSADTADPRPYQKEEAMDKYVNRAGGHANVGFQASVIRGNVYATPRAPEAGLDRYIRKLRRKLQTARLSTHTMSAAEAELARAQSHLVEVDGFDLDAFVATLEDFQRLVDGADELVDLADDAIAAAQRSDP